MHLYSSGSCLRRHDRRKGGIRAARKTRTVDVELRAVVRQRVIEIRSRDRYRCSGDCSGRREGHDGGGARRPDHEVRGTARRAVG